MLFTLSKILSFLFSPFIIAIILVICSLLFTRYRRKLLIISFFTILVFSNPFLFRLTIGIWEGAPMPLEKNNPGYRNVVVLGGMSALHKPTGRVRFTSASDRLMQALLFANQNTGSQIVLSGGNASITRERRAESTYLRDFLIETGWNGDKILVDSMSRNTRENAIRTRELFVERELPLEIVLVTSAWHMPRASRCFEKVGFTVFPVNTDFLSPMSEITPAEFWIPSASTLASWETLFKEWVGLLYYRARGYI